MRSMRARSAFIDATPQIANAANRMATTSNTTHTLLRDLRRASRASSSSNSFSVASMSGGYQDGRQLGCNLWSATSRPSLDPRLAPLRNTCGSRRTRSPYFRKALEHFGKAQVTRPYLSISTSTLCITVSISFKINDQIHVICGDIRSTSGEHQQTSL